MIKFCKLTIIVFLAPLLSNSVFAQNGKVMTLEECIEVALRNNSNFKIANYEVDRAGANVRGSYSSILPRFSLRLSSDRNTIGKSVNRRSIPVTDSTGAPVIDPETGEQVYDRVTTTQPRTSYYNHGLTLSFSQTLFDFGRNWNTIRQAKAGYESSSQSLVAARQEVYSTIKQRYLELLKAQRLEQEYEQAVFRSKEQLARTQSMYEIGSVAQIDVYRQEVTLGTDEINLVNQRNTVEIARGNLNVAMGRDPEAPISVADIEVQELDPSLTLEDAVTSAEQTNPELKRYEYDMKSAEYGRKVAKAAFWPSFTLSGFYNRDNEDFDKVYGQFGQNYFFQVGMNFDFDIFNGFSDSAEIGRQSANYSIARESWENTRRQTYLEVKRAYLNLKAYTEISHINERNLRAAEEDFRLANERYRVGAGTQLEVTEAQVSLTRARVNLVTAKYDAMIARAELEAAMGIIDSNKAE